MTFNTCSAEVLRLEAVDTGRRRRWTEEEKLRIVSESLSGPRSVSSTALRYGIVPSLLVTYRQQFGVRAAVGGTGLLPAMVVSEASARWPTASSRMEIVSANGRRIVVDAEVDVAALSRDLDVQERC